MPLPPSLLDLRREARHRTRAVRRLVDGARGLGAGATIQWAAGQVGHHESTVPTNSSFTWATASKETTTLAWLHNYWSDAYGIPSPHVAASLVGASGATVAAWSFDLAPDATDVIDVRELCRQFGVPLPFEGQLVLSIAHEKLVAGRPVQVFGEYVRDDGESSGVHGQYGFLFRPAAQIVGTMRADARDGRRTAVVITNGYVGGSGRGTLRSSITVSDAAGRSRQKAIAPIARNSTKVVFLDEAFPDLGSFLGDRPGHVQVKLPCPSSRLATYIEFPGDGTRVVNHGTVDRLFDQGSGVRHGEAESRPVASTLVECTDRRDTVLTLINTWGPVRGAYDVTVELRDERGVLLAEKDIRVAAGQLHEESMRSLLAGPGIELPVAAHAEIRIRPVAAMDEWPATFDVLVGFFDDGVLSGEVQVGSDFYNVPVPAGVSWPDIRRTRIFGRVRMDGTATTRVFLTHPGGPDRTETAHPTLTLLSPNGERRLTTELEIPAHGFVDATVDEFFPEGAPMLDPHGFGTIRVRDTAARLYGFYFVETPGARTVPICHLIGG